LNAAKYKKCCLIKLPCIAVFAGVKYRGYLLIHFIHTLFWYNIYIAYAYAMEIYTRRKDMCGRYVIFTGDEFEEMQRIVAEVEKKYGLGSVSTGEIFPTNSAPVFVAQEGQVGAELMTWGFPKYQGSGVIINARAETAAEKRTFSASLRSRRCVIPTTGFFEWRQGENAGQKEKFLFRLPDVSMVYLAGLYN